MHRCSAVQCIALRRVLLSCYLFVIYLYLYLIVHITSYSFPLSRFRLNIGIWEKH